MSRSTVEKTGDAAGIRVRDVYVRGIGSFSPGEPVPYTQIEDVLGHLTEIPEKLSRRLDRIRPLMRNMLGIEYSHYAIDPATGEMTESNTSMATRSSRKALEQAGLAPGDIDLIVYAGVLYDYMCPPNSVFVQEELGIACCAEITIHSNCTAIYKAIQVASDLIASGRYRNALVVTSQLSSPFFRPDYLNQKVLTEQQAMLRWFLSDGAGALVLSAEPRAGGGLLRVVDTYIESVGVGIEPTMKMMIGATRANVQKVYENGWHHLTQDFKVVADLAPRMFWEGLERMMKTWSVDFDRLRCTFLNIPTKHMMDLAIQYVENGLQRKNLNFYTKLGTRGYPGAPAILIALDEYLAENDLKSGDQLLSFVTESSKWMHAGFVFEAC